MYFVIEETGVARYNDARFYDSDENFDASIYVKGQNDIQTIMTHDSERNINYMSAKQGGALYTNLDNTMPTISNKTTIVVKTFGDDDSGNDRISLAKPKEGLTDKDITSSYRLQGTTLYREVKRFRAPFLQTPYFKTNCQRSQNKT